MPRDQHGRRIVGKVEAEEVAYRRRVLVVSGEERERLLRAIEDDGLGVVIDQVAGWVRRILTDPDDPRDPPLLGTTLQAHWRSSARALQEDGYRRPAEGARYVRELLRHDLDLRARRVQAPKGMDLAVVADILRARADMTAEQLADVAGLRWPPRTRAYRRRRPEPRAPRPPVDPVQRQRDRDAHDRETRDWQRRQFEERQRRILEDDDA